MNYDLNEVLKYTMTTVDRLCDTVGRTHFAPADPNSEFHWANISKHSGRKDLYQKFNAWLLEDTPVLLEDKQAALTAVVDNLCAHLERLACLLSPTVAMYDMNVRVIRYSEHKKSRSPTEVYALEELDMCMNSGYVFHASQERLNLFYQMLNENTTQPKVKL